VPSATGGLLIQAAVRLDHTGAIPSTTFLPQGASGMQGLRFPAGAGSARSGLVAINGGFSTGSGDALGALKNRIAGSPEPILKPGAPSVWRLPGANLLFGRLRLRNG